jgi:hypothetical protein
MTTKKTFEAVAAALAESRDAFNGSDGMLVQWNEDVRVIADVFAADNPRFDRARFYRACGVTGEGE